jgi:hypothetical protein
MCRKLQNFKSLQGHKSKTHLATEMAQKPNLSSVNEDIARILIKLIIKKIR